MPIHRLQRGEVILNGPLHGRVAVLADIDADRTGFALRHEIGDQAVHADVVEAHAVDDGRVAREAKHPWTRVSGLRPRRDRAYLEKPEAEIGKRADAFGV